MTKYKLISVGVSVTEEQKAWLDAKEESISYTIRKLCKEEMIREQKEREHLEI